MTILYNQLKKGFLFSVLFVFAFVAFEFIFTSVESNERARRLVADFKGLIHLNRYFKSEVLDQNVTRTLKANIGSSSHFVHIKNGEVDENVTRTMKANSSFVHSGDEKTTARVNPNINNSSHIKNEKITTVNTEKPTTSSSSRFVHIKNEKTTVNTGKPTTSSSSHFVLLNKLNPGNRALSTRQGECADIVCSNFLSTSEMHCTKVVAAKMKSVTRVTPRCRFQNGTMKPRVLLRTYPGSGNTWTREILEKSSGICTGN